MANPFPDPGQLAGVPSNSGQLAGSSINSGQFAANPIDSIHDGLEFWQFMIAGSVAGIAEHIAMFPVDTLKTRMQVVSAGTGAATMARALQSAVRQEGALVLWRGVGAVGLGAGPAHAIYFAVYERCKAALGAEHTLSHAAAGAAATVASEAVSTPMDVVKQRLQLSGGGLRECIKRVLRDEGFRGFYASYRTTVVMNAPFTAVHFAAYEAVKGAVVGEEEEGLTVHMTAGAAAGALAGAITTPLDVVKTRLQCQGVCGCDRYSSSSIGNVIQVIVRKEGAAGLIRGWRPRMLFHAPAAAICWSTYEACKAFFHQLNTTKAIFS
ncbi:mitoferrin [Amborella trichopoda]|uniref:mitoferrin n=1 Tax=Amborella trichopoda TaxID=13333 RepID=UPI0005D35D52|nr:mitoferrin [Amborella trichopoda]|eukprot:XP_011624472.1 mitoferrin [Amborella trichopoda]